MLTCLCGCHHIALRLCVEEEEEEEEEKETETEKEEEEQEREKEERKVLNYDLSHFFICHSTFFAIRKLSLSLTHRLSLSLSLSLSPIALTLSKGSQCASPVVTVKAEGKVRM